METVRQIVTVTNDRKVELTLPDTVPPGLVEMVIVLQPVSEKNPLAQPFNQRTLFGFLPKRTDPLDFQRQIRDEWNR